MSAGLEVRGYALRLRAPFPTARGLLRERRGFLVLARGAGGRLGLGEAAPLPPWTESLEACRAALREAAGHLEAPVAEPLVALARLDAAAPALARAPAARHGLALALLDLAAQEQGLPLADLLARSLLGGAAPRGSVPVNATVAAEEPAEAGRAARRAAAEGFAAVKLKLLGDAGRDDARVAAAREAIGAEVELRLDANGAWRREGAEARLRALAAWAPSFVEQPVPPDDLEGLARLRSLGIVRVAADEAAASPEGARRILAAGAADVLVVKPMALGGPDRAAALVADARRRGVLAVVACLLDGAVARAGALHCAALLPEPRPACGLATGALLAQDVARGPEVRRGRLEVPRGPGLGIGPQEIGEGAARA